MFAHGLGVITLSQKHTIKVVARVYTMVFPAETWVMMLLRVSYRICTLYLHMCGRLGALFLGVTS